MARSPPVPAACATSTGIPADRLILATALEGHRLLTADARLLDWSGGAALLDARL